MHHPFINIDLPFAANIPPEYVPEKELRLRLYRRLADIHNLENLAAIEEEFSDRFGEPPEVVDNLLYQLKIKILAEEAGLTSVSHETKQIVLRYPSLPEGSPARQYPNLGKDVYTGKNAVRLPLTNVQDWHERLIELLEQLARHESEERQPA